MYDATIGLKRSPSNILVAKVKLRFISTMNLSLTETKL